MKVRRPQMLRLSVAAVSRVFRLRSIAAATAPRHAASVQAPRPAAETGRRRGGGAAPAAFMASSMHGVLRLRGR